MFETQRRHPRVETSLLLYLEQRDSEGRVRFNTVGHVINLSEGGLLAEVHCPVEPGYEPAVVVALGPECVELRTRLRRLERIHSGCYRMAFQFDRRSRRVRNKIASYLGGKAA